MDTRRSAPTPPPASPPTPPAASPPAGPAGHARIDELAVGGLRMVRVGDQRICLARTAEGVFAVDHACPHMGYGMTQGTLDGTTITCAWHNWKFDVRTGRCLMGDEDITAHAVHVDDSGAISVTVHRPDPMEQHDRLLSSLRSGIARNRVGQISREVVRLLRLGADPAQLVWEAVAHGAPRGEYGWGHDIANATDCLAMVELFDGDDRALPVVQAIAGIAEVSRDRPPNALPEPLTPLPADARHAFATAVEAERLDHAQALVAGALRGGAGPQQLRSWFTDVVSRHLLDYGHGAIFTQKAFELLELVGWQHAEPVLGHLVTGIVTGTREDTLPYMRPFMRTLADADLDDLGQRPADPAWSGIDALVAVLLGAERTAVVPAVIAALHQGAGVDGVLDGVVAAAAERMLRYDVAQEASLTDDFGWLDITHVLTYANAARYLHLHTPGADTVRLAMFTAFLAQWSGRHEWHTAVGPAATVDRPAGSIAEFGEALQRRALTDPAGSFIVAAHDVKASRAASIEAQRSGSFRPLQAVARYMDGPRRQRFVAATVAQSIEFIAGRAPRDT